MPGADEEKMQDRKQWASFCPFCERDTGVVTLSKLGRPVFGCPICRTKVFFNDEAAIGNFAEKYVTDQGIEEESYEELR